MRAKVGDGSVHINRVYGTEEDVDHARLDTISEKARFHGTGEGPLNLSPLLPCVPC